MLRTTWNRARTFLSDFRLDILARTASMDVLWLGWLSNDPLKLGGGDQFGFALVPLFEYLLGRCTA